MNDKDLEKRKKKMTMKQLALWSKSNQSGNQSSRSNERKKKKPKCKPKPKNICQECGEKEHQSRIPEYPKYKNKKRKKSGNSTNYTINKLYLGGKKNLGKREVRQILMVRENIGGKKLLLNCSAIAYMFDEQHYFAFYTPT